MQQAIRNLSYEKNEHTNRNALKAEYCEFSMFSQCKNAQVDG